MTSDKYGRSVVWKIYGVQLKTARRTPYEQIIQRPDHSLTLQPYSFLPPYKYNLPNRGWQENSLALLHVDYQCWDYTYVYRKPDEDGGSVICVRQYNMYMFGSYCYFMYLRARRTNIAAKTMNTTYNNIEEETSNKPFKACNRHVTTNHLRTLIYPASSCTV